MNDNIFQADDIGLKKAADLEIKEGICAVGLVI
jgi:hypothetical protein